MYANAHFEFVPGSVSEDEAVHSSQQSQGQAADLHRVTQTITERDSGHHHVGIAYSLHLWSKVRSLL